VQGTGETEGDICKDAYAPTPGSADRQSARPPPRRHSADGAVVFRTENAAGPRRPPRRQKLGTKVERFSAQVAERAWRGGDLTSPERAALLELIDAIATLLREED
jgi:hypothetical protein